MSEVTRIRAIAQDMLRSGNILTDPSDHRDPIQIVQALGRVCTELNQTIITVKTEV